MKFVRFWMKMLHLSGLVVVCLREFDYGKLSLMYD